MLTKLKMSKLAFEKIISNSDKAESMIKELKNEIKTLTNDYNKTLITKLINENKYLEKEIDLAKKKLVRLEIQNGVSQVPVPNQTIIFNNSECKGLNLNIGNANIELHRAKSVNPSITLNSEKNIKPKKIKGEIIQNEKSVDFGRLDLRIGKVLEAQLHPDASSLYVLKVHCGEEKPRTVCSGLVKYVPLEQLKDKTVVLLCNLKPVKMRGITSEAMVMCASSPEVVEVLKPPHDSLPGDFVCCDGYLRQPDSVMNPKKKIFESVAPDLHTNELLQACYKGVPWNVSGKGQVVASTLKNVSVK